MKLNDLTDRAHLNAKLKGFHDQKREFGTSLMLIVSELGEALEAHREGERYLIKLTPEEWQEATKLAAHGDSDGAFRYLCDRVKHQPVGHWKEEIADTYIRLGDLCGEYRIDVERAVQDKMSINAKRAVRHGKQY